MLNALYSIPRKALRALIIWALAAGNQPIYDPAALDKISAENQ